MYPDEEQFITILEQYKERLFRICRIYAGQGHEPEDLFQEVVVNLWQSIAHFKGDSHIYTWLYRVTLNVCMRKHYQYKNQYQQKVALEGIRIIKQAPEDTQEQVESREQKEALYACIRQLKKPDQSIILLYLDNLPYKDIAGIVGISENHVAVKVKRIKKQLHNCLKAAGHGR